MTQVTLPSYAKVNLYLDVLGKRPDGYHELETLFERIDLWDEITLSLSPGSSIEAESSHPAVPSDGTNLAVKAASVYQKLAGISQGLRIVIHKKIPVAGGLGGGSSNAAAVLTGLQKLYGNILPEERLLDCARSVGSDVPFFLMSSAWAFGTGRGDQIETVSLETALWHLLVAPGFPISTKAVYEAFQPSKELHLTAHGGDVTLLTDALRGNDLWKIRGLLFNALEPTVEALYPAMGHVKETIQTKGGIPCPLVSGSGSTVMAVCSSRAEAEAAAESIKRQEPGWQLFVVRTGL